MKQISDSVDDDSAASKRVGVPHAQNLRIRDFRKTALGDVGEDGDHGDKKRRT
jgi:hypothetical protein